MSEPTLAPEEVSNLHVVIHTALIGGNPKQSHRAYFAEYIAKRGEIAGDNWFLAVPLAREIEARYPDTVVDYGSLADALGDASLARAALRLAGAVERKFAATGVVRWEVGNPKAGSEPVRFPAHFLDQALAAL